MGVVERQLSKTLRIIILYLPEITFPKNLKQQKNDKKRKDNTSVFRLLYSLSRVLSVCYAQLLTTHSSSRSWVKNQHCKGISIQQQGYSGKGSDSKIYICVICPKIRPIISIHLEFLWLEYRHAFSTHL